MIKFNYKLLLCTVNSCCTVCIFIVDILAFKDCTFSLVCHYYIYSTLITLFLQKIKLLEKLCLLYTPNDVWRKYLAVRNQQIKRFLQNPAILDGTDIDNVSTPDEDIPDEALCLARVSYALDKMFEQDYNIISLGMFPEALQMHAEEVGSFKMGINRVNSQLELTNATFHEL